GDAATTIQRAGGAFVYAYPQIGVVVADSNSPGFRANLLKDSRVDNASGTSRFATGVADGAGSQLDSTGASGAPPGPSNAPVNGQDSLAPLQWDMIQIHTPDAHASTGGSPSIL